MTLRPEIFKSKSEIGNIVCEKPQGNNDEGLFKICLPGNQI